MRAIKIPAEASAPLEEVDIPAGFPQMNIAILGSSDALIQEVYAKGLHVISEQTGHQTILLVDEEGLIKNLPLNKRASVLYGTHVHTHPIVGDAWVVSSTREDWISLSTTIGTGQIHGAIDHAIRHADEVFA